LQLQPPLTHFFLTISLNLREKTERGKMDLLAAKSSMVEFEFCGASDIGKQRESNQDQFLIAQLHKVLRVAQSSFDFGNGTICGDTMGTLMFVADGIGGNPAGDVASRMAIEEVCRFVLNSMHWLHAEDHYPSEAFVKDLVASFERTHRVVRRNADSHFERTGMGTTLTLAYIVWPNLYVVHAGDSRCYHRHQNELIRITTDQTIGQALCEKGVLKPEEVEDSRYGHVLWSCIGAIDDPTAVIYQRRLTLGDTVLLCSDGVTKYLTDDRLNELMSSSLSCHQVCETAINECNEAGGDDNITIVLTRCVQPALVRGR
jgi:serine/threonine protein phosphatase PrpC